MVGLPFSSLSFLLKFLLPTVWWNQRQIWASTLQNPFDVWIHADFHWAKWIQMVSTCRYNIHIHHPTVSRDLLMEALSSSGDLGGSKPKARHHATHRCTMLLSWTTAKQGQWQERIRKALLYPFMTIIDQHDMSRIQAVWFPFGDFLTQARDHFFNLHSC